MAHLAPVKHDNITNIAKYVHAIDDKLFLKVFLCSYEYNIIWSSKLTVTYYWDEGGCAL